MRRLGEKLRGLRNEWQLTLRDVEERSANLAKQWGDPAYKVSASWLARAERGMLGVSAQKLIVLASIYALTSEQVSALCPIPSLLIKGAEQVVGPNVTRLLTEGPLEEHARLLLPEKLVTDPPPENTVLLASETGMPAHYMRGIIGRRDRTLEPMILPGSIVLIDTRKKSIAGRREWHHEFDRPIYFLLTRHGYVTGFCELDRTSEWLTLVPHPLSYESNKRWHFSTEIDVIGTVAGVFTRRVA